MKKKKRFSTQDHVNIVFEIFRLVPYSHRTTAQAIQRQLVEKDIHRDIRTIQRNLNLLVSMAFIDQDCRSKPYGYQNIIKHLSPISTKEALVLQLAIEHLYYLMPNNAVRALDGRFEDAKLALFPSTENIKERQWLKKVVSEQPNSTKAKIIIEKLTTALYHNHWINLSLFKDSFYHMPLGLIQKGAGIELVTGIYQKQKLITYKFNIHDIQDIKLSTFTFEYPQSFDLKLYLKEQSQ